VTETQKWKAVRTNVRDSFVQAIEKAVVLFCVNRQSCKAMRKSKSVSRNRIVISMRSRAISFRARHAFEPFPWAER
jgi:hypothetical protein